MTPQQQNDPFLACEALDRCYLIRDMTEIHLITHPWILKNKEALALAEKAAATLGDLYQLIGSQGWE